MFRVFAAQKLQAVLTIVELQASDNHWNECNND